MGKIRRKFSLEFKQQVIQEIGSGQKTLSQAAREYQVSANAIIRWRQQAQQQQLTATPSAREKTLEGENQRLRAKVGELVMQVDFLKNYHASIQRQRNADTSVISARNLDQFRKRAK
ncbi:MAG: transposase [Acidobacteriota bacterium]